jgi:replicative DNA helicase
LLFLEVGVHVVHGKPGSGKTAWALQVAANSGCPTLFVSTEMGAQALLRRVAARTTGTFLGRFRTGELPPAEAIALARHAAEAVPDLHIRGATVKRTTPEWIRDALPLVQGTAPYALLVIDSIHSWARGLRRDGVSEYESLGDAMSQLVSVAQELRVAVLATSERNRADMDGGLHAGAGSRTLEFQPSTVLDLGRAPEALANGEGEREQTLTIVKNRDGVERKFSLLFNGAQQRFMEQ